MNDDPEWIGNQIKEYERDQQSIHLFFRKLAKLIFPEKQAGYKKKKALTKLAVTHDGLSV